MYYDIEHSSLTGTGNASNSINPRFFNEKFDHHGTDKRPIYQNVLNVCPIDKTKPVFSRSHEVPDLTILRNKFPKICHIIVKLNKVGKMIACLQDFQKNFVDQYRLGTYSNSYDKWTNFSQKYFDSITNPKNVTEQQLIKFAENIGKSSAIYPYDETDNIYNAINIDLTDIYFKKDFVLSLLSDLLDRPINQYATQYYDTYLSKQQKIVSLLSNTNISIDSHIHN